MRLRLSWGTGAVIAVLLSVAFYLFQLPFASTLPLEMATMVLLVGGWTVVAAFTVVETKDRMYFTSWGIILAALSLFAFVNPSYALGVLLIAVVLLILLMALKGKGEVITAASSRPSTSGGTPAAT